LAQPKKTSEDSEQIDRTPPYAVAQDLATHGNGVSKPLAACYLRGAYYLEEVCHTLYGIMAV